MSIGLGFRKPPRGGACGSIADYQKRTCRVGGFRKDCCRNSPALGAPGRCVELQRVGRGVFVFRRFPDSSPPKQHAWSISRRHTQHRSRYRAVFCAEAHLPPGVVIAGAASEYVRARPESTWTIPLSRASPGLDWGAFRRAPRSCHGSFRPGGDKEPSFPTGLPRSPTGPRQ